MLGIIKKRLYKSFGLEQRKLLPPVAKNLDKKWPPNSWALDYHQDGKWHRKKVDATLSLSSSFHGHRHRRCSLEFFATRFLQPRLSRLLLVTAEAARLLVIVVGPAERTSAKAFFCSHPLSKATAFLLMTQESQHRLFPPLFAFFENKGYVVAWQRKEKVFSWGLKISRKSLTLHALHKKIFVRPFLPLLYPMNE